MQPGVGPRPPALGLALSSQPSLLGQPRTSLLPGAESCPVLGLWASRGTVSLLQTSSGHAWVLCGPQFLLCSPVPGSTFCLGILPLRSRTCVRSLLVLPHPRGREGVSSPTPARAGEALWWEQGPGHGLEPPPERPAFLSQCSYPVKSGACWRSAQGVLKGFHILF